MDRKKKIGLAVLIVAIGVGIALQFKRTTSPVDSNTAVPSAGFSTVAPSSSAAESDATVQKPAAKTSAFDGRIEPAPLAGLMKPAVDDEPERPLVDLNQPDKIHKIVDGDTLEKLAQRYLGRADRYVDLYSYNRDVLSDPAVLPIGAELRIPSHAVLAGQDQSVVTPVMPLAPLPTPPPAPPAAAVPSTAAATTPAKNSSQRTYKVQPGDTLVDIARKMYGDGRKHTELFEANRRAMRTPTDLKPGMLLVVP